MITEVKNLELNQYSVGQNRLYSELLYRNHGVKPIQLLRDTGFFAFDSDPEILANLKKALLFLTTAITLGSGLAEIVHPRTGYGLIKGAQCFRVIDVKQLFLWCEVIATTVPAPVICIRVLKRTKYSHWKEIYIFLTPIFLKTSMPEMSYLSLQVFCYWVWRWFPIWWRQTFDGPRLLHLQCSRWKRL